MAHDAAPELGDRCLIEAVLLIGAKVVEAVREVDGHYRAVVAHQKERAAEALFRPGVSSECLPPPSDEHGDVLILVENEHKRVEVRCERCGRVMMFAWRSR